jgi:hypothetical protein
VDDSALTIYVASCEKLEELGYSVEERSAELEIMLIEDDTPYDGDVMVSPADFLNLGPVPLNELAVVMDVRPVREATRVEAAARDMKRAKVRFEEPGLAMG